MRFTRQGFTALSNNGLILVISAFLVLAAMPFSDALGAVPFAVWSGAIIWRIATHFVARHGLLMSLFLAAIAFGSAGMGAALVIFFGFSVTPLVVGAAFLLLTFGALRIPRKHVRLRIPALSLEAVPLTARLALLIQAVVLGFLFAARTSAPLISPWTILPASVFLLFFLSALLTAVTQLRSDKWTLVLASTQTFLAVGVSAAMYGIGFGFDPFVHRAAETALVTHGAIEPTSLLYSGQYAVVGILHFLTGISVSAIDIWLLPIAVSLLLPLAAYLGLRDGWRVPERAARLGWMSALFLPFMLFTFTVPFTFSYVAFVAGLFLFPLLRHGREIAAILLAAALLTITLHPLLGAPLVLLFFAAALCYRIKNRPAKVAVLAALSLATACSVPVLLWVYQHGTGMSVDPWNLLLNIGNFFSLFANPFGAYDPAVVPLLNGLYILRYWQPVVLIAAALLFIPLFARYRRQEIAILSFFLFGLLLCTYGVSTLFVFKNIISHEQREFALRLLQAIYTVPLPLVALFFAHALNRRYLRPLALTSLSILVTTSWFFSYPQFNAKFAYYSPSVSQDDVSAVRYMDEASNGKPYIVLANQMTSAAALQEFGFAHYYMLEGEQVLWYPIPTGGPLYQYYLSAISSAERTTFIALAEQMEVERVYVVMHAYWPWHATLVEKLAQQSDHIESIEGRVTIYQFDR